MIKDFEAWGVERGAGNRLYWQYDVLDGGEESISGSRYEKNIRPPLNSYMYGNAMAIAKAAEMAGKNDIAKVFWNKASRIKSLLQELMWDSKMQFFKARLEKGTLCDAREAIGFIPWYFNLPDQGYERAWLQVKDKNGFDAPMGLTTAERRHPLFRANGVGTCEWDGAIWPFCTSQSLTAMANLLRNYNQNYVTKKDYFDELMTYAKSQNRDGQPYIGEYIDEVTGEWLTTDTPRSRFYNHSTFCDLVISGLVGFVPREDGSVEIDPLVPGQQWPWFCLDNLLYNRHNITILWDKTGRKYDKGKGFVIFADGKEIARRGTLGKLMVELP
jgi:hypothetical protein